MKPADHDDSWQDLGLIAGVLLFLGVVLLAKEVVMFLSWPIRRWMK